VAWLREFILNQGIQRKPCSTPFASMKKPTTAPVTPTEEGTVP
jgi:hypothetical protein